MQTASRFPVPKLLRYAFLALTLGSALFLALNFSSSISGPFLRGYVDTHSVKVLAESALPEAQGTLKVLNYREKQVVLLVFASPMSLLKLRHLFYLFSDNLRWILAIMAMYQMYRISLNLDHRKVFCEENVRRIRTIAFCVLIYPFLALEATFQFKAIVSRIPDHGLNLSPVPILHESLVVGVLLSLIIYALAEVFRTGSHLQQEQDLTI